MKLNVGGVERGIRIALGVALLALAFFANIGVWVYVVGVVGVVALVTGLVQYCPLSALLGFNTYSPKKP